MNIIFFLKNLIKDDGFVLIDSNSNEFVIGKPKKIKSNQNKIIR